MTCLIASWIYIDVEACGSPIYSTLDAAPAAPVAIVFGSGIGTSIARDRVNSAVALYRAGKVQKLLMTGDNGQSNYDEPTAMKAQAVKQGVPSADVVCDYAGFRTYDSVYRARDIFCVQKAILVTQRFHLPRAMFLARRLGLDVVGYDAAPRTSYGVWHDGWFNLREVAAVEAAWFDVLLQRKPKFLGKQEPIAFGPVATNRAVR